MRRNDLFPLKVEGGIVSKWIMLVSINPGGLNGGSATQYFVASMPAVELKALRKELRSVYIQTGNLTDGQVFPVDSLKLQQSELTFEFNLAGRSADTLGIVLENNIGERFTVGYSVSGKHLSPFSIF